VFHGIEETSSSKEAHPNLKKEENLHDRLGERGKEENTPSAVGRKERRLDHCPEKKSRACPPGRRGEGQINQLPPRSGEEEQ